MAKELWKLTSPPVRATRMQFRDEFPGTVIADGADLEEFGYVVATVLPRPDYAAETQKLEPALPVKQGGSWRRGWNIIDLTQSEIENKIQKQRARLNVTRPQLIKALAKNQVITPTAAIEWAIGTNLPSGLVNAIDNSGGTAAERISLKIDAVSAPNVARLSPLFLLIKNALSLNDTQADNLFRQANNF